MSLEKVFIGSTGLFAGFTLAISVSAVPTIAISQKPKDTWQKIYVTGKNTVIPFLLTTAVSGGLLYSRTRNPKILAATIIGAFSMPFTLLGMRSNIKTLEGLSNADPKVPELTRTWANLHMVRTVAGITSFGLALYALS
ncbi:hypothetical protein BGW37DRAFT_498257 [Umbelopsis sp. PMI_123]|nr:hypothetical protein BGW37DRAFT_498257 [Umbelopsis sp. PMI_123]